jgi:hypothetical protein
MGFTLPGCMVAVEGAAPGVGFAGPDGVEGCCASSSVLVHPPNTEKTIRVAAVAAQNLTICRLNDFMFMKVVLVTIRDF